MHPVVAQCRLTQQVPSVASTCIQHQPSMLLLQALLDESTFCGLALDQDNQVRFCISCPLLNKQFAGALCNCCHCRMT